MSRTFQRTREFRGPEPCSVGILERHGQGSFNAAAQLQAVDNEYARRQAGVRDQISLEQRAKWEIESRERLMQARIRQRFAEKLAQQSQPLLERQIRLHDMLEGEDRELSSEVEKKFANVEVERVQQMKERARQLRENRERLREELAQEKYDQQLLDTSEELRTRLSKQRTVQVARERLEQIRVKDELAKDEREADRMYAELWAADHEARKKREEQEALARADRTRDMMEIVHQQMAELEQRRANEKRLKAEEGKIIDDMNRVLRLDKERELEEKRRRADETRALFDRAGRLKAMRMAQQAREELEFDLKMLAKIQEDLDRQRNEELRRKREMNEENRNYREYLAKTLEEEKARERELERLCDVEIEKAWQQRAERYRKEKEARREMMKKIMDGLMEQIKERLVEKAKEREQAEIERQDLVARIQENERLAKEEDRERLRKARAFGSELRAQLAYNEDLRAAEREEHERELERYKAAEAEYEARMQRVLAKTLAERTHPFKSALIEEARAFGVRTLPTMPYVPGRLEQIQRDREANAKSRTGRAPSASAPRDTTHPLPAIA